MTESKSIVIGILAHVDAGKTTLAEALLYDCGTTAKLGRVDHGDAFLDTDIQERERGITIFAKQAELELAGSDGSTTKATLVDTPGHVDFTAETERTLGVLDYAILVVNGRDGVQQHTRTLASLLEEYRIPCFVWINKLDLAGVDEQEVLAQLKSEINPNIVVLKQHEEREDFADDCAVCDESLMEELLATGSLKDESIAESIKERLIFPCYSGSALKNIGVDELARGIADYSMGYTDKDAEEEFSAFVYRISHDEKDNRLTHMKICAGTLRPKDIIAYGAHGTVGADNSAGEKVNQIRLYNGGKFTALDEAKPGMLVAVTGLTKSFAGQSIGNAANARGISFAIGDMFELRYPVTTDVFRLLEQLKELEEELPELQLYMTDDKRFLLRLAGRVQKDVVLRMIADRYGIEAELVEYVPEPPEEEEIIEEEEIDDRPDLNARWAGEEKDLDRIFEMTYGPEKKQVIRPARELETGSSTMKKQEILREYLLIDGYNVIFAWEDLRELGRKNIDSAREALIHIIQEYRSTTDAEAIIVFDAYKVRGGRGHTEKHENIYVVYTDEAESADSYIERMTYNIRKKYRSRVVTSDVAEQIIIMGNNSTAVTAESFRKEVEQANEQIRDLLESYKARPNIEFRNRIKIDISKREEE